MVDRTVTIRDMLPEDIAAVAQLTPQLGYAVTEEDILRRFKVIRERTDARLFVAQPSGRAVAGWVHVQELHMLESDARAEIFGLVVADTARGTGIGRRLIEAAEDWAMMRGLAVMGLRSNQLRTEARGFYEHLGYTVIKTQNAFRKSLVY